VTSSSIKREVQVALGEKALSLGKLTFVRDGRREYSGFVYSQSWLTAPDRFEVSPDLPLTSSLLTRRAPSEVDSPFHFAFADTAPDTWGRRVIQRAHAKRRAADKTLGVLTAFDFLAAVDDFSRIGALRLIETDGKFLGSSDKHRTPHLVDLGNIAAATRKVEKGTETSADLEYLQGKGTSLGGLRPKCTLIDEGGTLAIGKFPSISDTHSVVRSEVLALHLLAHAGSIAARSRAIVIDKVEVAIIERFDRQDKTLRIPYLSGGSFLQARRDEEHSYTELADVIRQIGAEPVADLKELWRRLVINLLLTNVDDHLWNIAFLHDGQGKWRLSPAFDVNPFPDKDRESKTWLSPDTGPISSLEQLLAGASYFGLPRNEAEAIAGGIALKLADWREIALSKEVGLKEKDLKTLEPAFEHSEAFAARSLAR
jgi:serine/threonine-protein kinase HipA